MTRDQRPAKRGAPALAFFLIELSARQESEEKVVPAMEAKAAQAQQQWEQSKAEQDAIVARYPELRGCTKDQVVFLDGGVRTVPVSEIKMPVTLAQADSIVERLR
jgi:hypothetical protein